jgi:two-component system response regulator
MGKVFRVLLVEDNQDDEELTIRSLRKLGDQIKLEVARDGQEALDQLSDSSKQLPNLILLDLHLPKIGGLQVLEQIRADERTAHILVVVLTSSDEPADVRASYQQYANSYIHKPVSLADFSDAVQRMGVYWLELNLNPG